MKTRVKERVRVGVFLHRRLKTLCIILQCYPSYVTNKRVLSLISVPPITSAIALLAKLFFCWLPKLSILEVACRSTGQSENCCFICLVSQLFRHLKYLAIIQSCWDLLLWSASQNKEFTKKNNKLLANIICMVIALQCLLNQFFWHSFVIAEIGLLIYYDKMLFSFYFFSLN